MIVSYRSEKGITSNTNEDYVYFKDAPNYVFMGIADGQQSIHSFYPAVFALEEMEEWLARKKIDNENQLYMALQDAFFHVQKMVQAVQGIVGNTPTASMTILVIPKKVKRVGLVLHIGNTRLYGFRAEHGLQQLTVNHTEVENLLQNNQLTPKEASKSPLHASLTKHIGFGQPDLFLLDFTVGDRFLLVSDGVYQTLTEEEIVESFVQTQTIDEARDVLLEMAKERQNFDDCTCSFLFMDTE